MPATSLIAKPAILMINRFDPVAPLWLVEKMQLTQEAWTEISRHAQETFPEECCGVIFSAGATDQVVPVKNIQNNCTRSILRLIRAPRKSLMPWTLWSSKR